MFGTNVGGVLSGSEAMSPETVVVLIPGIVGMGIIEIEH